MAKENEFIEAWIGDRRYWRVARNWRKEKRHTIVDVMIKRQLRRVRCWHGIWIVEDSFWHKNGKRRKFSDKQEFYAFLG